MVIVPVELGNDQNIAGLQLLHEPAKHWDQATAMPDDEREIAKHYALDRSGLDLVMRQNRPHNRLGLACVLAMLRYPDRPLADSGILPHGVLKYLARQIGVDHREIHKFFERPRTRRGTSQGGSRRRGIRFCLRYGNRESRSQGCVK